MSRLNDLATTVPFRWYLLYPTR